MLSINHCLTENQLIFQGLALKIMVFQSRCSLCWRNDYTSSMKV
ncbi:hypothetical protein FDUTEX481_08134 [Tolypothrix sp. PCC 7601]|nr:hypothetical protein FDUTEX481_08134 [Tolypothrix sp. PCC 7601]